MQNFPVEFSQMVRTQSLKAAAERGEVQPPAIDPSNPADLAKLSHQELELVSRGLYADARTTATDEGPAVVLPEGWTPEKLRQVQADYPSDWRSAVRSCGGQA